MSAPIGVKLTKGEIRYIDKNRDTVVCLKSDSIGNLVLNNANNKKKIKNVAMCVNDYDVANKKYVDNKFQSKCTFNHMHSFNLTTSPISITNDDYLPIIYFLWNPEAYKINLMSFSKIKILCYVYNSDSILHIKIDIHNKPAVISEFNSENNGMCEHVINITHHDALKNNQLLVINTKIDDKQSNMSESTIYNMVLLIE